MTDIKDSYYVKQMRKFEDDWAIKEIKIMGSGGVETNWISLNDESIDAIIDFLKEEKGKE